MYDMVVICANERTNGSWILSTRHHEYVKPIRINGLKKER